VSEVAKSFGAGPREGTLPGSDLRRRQPDLGAGGFGHRRIGPPPIPDPGADAGVFPGFCDVPGRCRWWPDPRGIGHGVD
jgi:hypothetical protein